MTNNPPRSLYEIVSNEGRIILNALVSGRTKISHVEIANAVVEAMRQAQLHPVHDGQRLWWFDAARGHYVAAAPSDIRNLIHDLDQPGGGDAAFRVNASTASGVDRVVRDRLHQDDFFNGASSGIVAGNHFITVSNGELDMREAAADQRQVGGLALPYLPNADPALWDAFLREGFGSPEVIDFVNEIVGASILGLGHRYQRIIVLHGQGQNGKTTLIEVLTHMLPPEFRSAVSPDLWSFDYHRCPLQHARLNVCGDIGEISRRDIPYLKSLSGGDLVTARRVGGNAFQFRCRALHIFAANRLPRLPDAGFAMRRRFAVLPMSRVIADSQVQRWYDRELLSAGGTGIVRRAIEGAQRLLDRGDLALPQPVIDATDAWFGQSNPVQLFARECIERVSDPGVRVTSRDMFDACSRFCDQRVLSGPASARELRDGLEALGFTITKSSTMQWTGVRLKPAA